MTKLQVRVRSSRGLCGYNSNLVIRWRVWGCIFSLIIEIVLRGGTILMVEGRVGGGVEMNPVTVSPAPMWAHRRILGQAGNRTVGTILSVFAGKLEQSLWAVAVWEQF